MTESAPNDGPGPQEIIDLLAAEQPGPVEGVTDLGDGSYDLTVGKILVGAELPPNGTGKK